MLLQTSNMEAEMMPNQSSSDQHRRQLQNISRMPYSKENFKSVVCHSCGYACNSRWEMLKHKEAEHPFKTSYSPVEMQGSLKFHVCEFCGYKSTLKSDVTRHRRTHTGERPFKCLLCPYSSTQQANLLRHNSVHECGVCDYRSADRHDLIYHRKTQHYHS